LIGGGIETFVITLGAKNSSGGRQGMRVYYLKTFDSMPRFLSLFFKYFNAYLTIKRFFSKERSRYCPSYFRWRLCELIIA